MSIPLATHVIDVYRPTGTQQTRDPEAQGYDDTPIPQTPVLVATSVRAVIAPGSGRGVSNAGESETVEYSLRCDPTDLSYLDTVIDTADDTAYEVVWALTTPGIAGLGHTAAGLRTTKGQS